MTFDQALIAMREGKKVRRDYWNPKWYVALDGLILYEDEQCYDGAVRELTNLPIGDILATDWQVVP